MIRFQCPDCSAPIAVEDKHAGKTGKCPKCREKVTIPQGDTVRTEVTQKQSVLIPEEPDAADLLAQAAVEQSEATHELAPPIPHQTTTADEARRTLPEPIEPPRYGALLVIAQLYEVVGLILIAIGGSIFFLGVIDNQIGRAIIATASGVGSGLAVYAVGQMLRAFRDIAQNSWSWKDTAAVLRPRTET